MPRPDGEGNGTNPPVPQPKPTQAPQAPSGPLFEPPVVEVEVKTLGAVPGLYELLKQQGKYSFTPRAIDRPLDAVSGAELGLGVDEIGELGADQESTSPLGELTLDGASPIANPMDDMKLPTLESLGIKKTSTTTYTTSGGGVAPSGWRKSVLDFARQMLGTPYVWGGTSEGGVDCSGLIVLAFKQAGISMPRISADQARRGKRIGLGDLRPGDLVAWDNSSRNNGADHIAIYIGNGMIIEAPRPGRNVQISSIYDKGNAWGVSLDF